MSTSNTVTSTEPFLTLATARLMVAKMEEECNRRNLKMVFAIVDQHGNLKLYHRMDGSFAVSIKAAQAKASTAAMAPFNTRVLGEMSAKSAGNPYAHIEGLLLMGGGVPIFNEAGVHLGGMGASGSTPEIDEEIAIFGVDSIDGISYTRG